MSDQKFINQCISINGSVKVIVFVLVFMLVVQFFSNEGTPDILAYMKRRTNESKGSLVYVLSIVISMFSSTELERKVISSRLSIAEQTNSKLVNCNTLWATCKSKFHLTVVILFKIDMYSIFHMFSFYCMFDIWKSMERSFTVWQHV